MGDFPSCQAWRQCTPIWEHLVKGKFSFFSLSTKCLSGMSGTNTFDRAIRISWLCLGYPSLLLAYIGQAAYISNNPSAYSNPFFNSVPPGTYWPALIISIIATVVASQALITGTFQLISQAMKLSCFPEVNFRHTSGRIYGQIYIPLANWLLGLGTILVVIVYHNVSLTLELPDRRSCVLHDFRLRC